MTGRMAEDAEKDDQEPHRKHHIRQNICATRPAYREGRNPKAVKVYTVSQESRYLLLQGVPALGVVDDLIKLCALYGAVEEYRILHEYPTEDFLQVIWVKYQRLQAARVAKRKLDDCSFFGGVLHACYAPEYESMADTRSKLLERRREVARRIHIAEQESPTTVKKISRVDDTDSSPTPASVNNVDFKDHNDSSRQNMPIGSTANHSHDAPAVYASHDALPPMQSRQQDAPPFDWRFTQPPPPYNYPITPWLGDDTPAHQLIRSNGEHHRSFTRMAPPCTERAPNMTHDKPDASTPYPSMTPGKYSGSTPHETTPVVSNPAAMDRLTDLHSAGKLVVKVCERKTGATPKFVPRQLGMAKPVKARSTVASVCSEQLRRNACVLGAVSGPVLPSGSPSETSSQTSTVCDASYKRSISTIRQTINQMSSAPQDEPIRKKLKNS